VQPTRPARILVVTDHTAATPELLAAIRERAARGSAQFRVLVPNPAHAEAHLLHPERHEKAAEAEQTLRAALPAFEQAAGGHVIGSVSIRNEPGEAVEELIMDEPVDEIMLSVAEHGFAKRLHLDLPHRLAHFGLPIMNVGPEPES
jgi:hypothetical protein